VEDLRKFYDYYMKDISTGWEFTPKVRLCILNPGNKDIVNRPEDEFPIARQQSKALFLDAASSVMNMDKQVQVESRSEFDAVTGKSTFTYTFPDRTELTGYFKLKLWVESVGNDDIDLFTVFSKLNGNRQLVETQCIDVGYLQNDPDASRQKLREMHAAGEKSVNVYFARGATGRLRVSHRELDPNRTTSHQPHYKFEKIQKLSGGEIVAVEIELWPHGMIWEAGETIELTIAGHNLMPELTPRTPPVKTLNKGIVVIHTGGRYDSHLLIPVIPPRKE
jgi:uncharacterized protein